MTDATTAHRGKPRILIVVSSLGLGGAERQVIQIVNQLGAAGYDIHLCSLSDHLPLADSLNSPENLVVIKKKGRFDISTVWQLRSLLKRLEIDVVHGFLFDAEIASRLAGWLAGTPRVIGSERNSDHNYSRLNLIAYKLTTRFMDLCVPNSRAGQSYNQKTFGLADDRYQVVYNGVDTERFRPLNKKALRADANIDTRFVIGMVASFKAQKNHAYLLRAIARLRQLRGTTDDASDLSVLLVGATVHEGMSETAKVFEDTVALVDELGLTDCVRFLGGRTDVENVYNLCDFTVLPSYFEGTPNVALEAMACGVPVVATDVADNAIVIPDGEVGRIVPIDEVDALAGVINELLLDQAELDAMSAKARRWIETNFALDVMSANMASVYEGKPARPLTLEAKAD